jgi:hypothetical protein
LLDLEQTKAFSFELIDLPLIARVAAAGKPTIMSTGMADPEEIVEAAMTFRTAGGRELLLLYCVSGYPTPAAQSNLRRIVTLSQEFDCPVGLSDHTLTVEVAIAAVALGACLIEKHFTLRRSDGGPDAAFSLEPAELSQLVCGARVVFEALGTGSVARSDVEKSNMKFRRSLYVVEDPRRRTPHLQKYPHHPPRLWARSEAPAGGAGQARAPPSGSRHGVFLERDRIATRMKTVANKQIKSPVFRFRSSTLGGTVYLQLAVSAPTTHPIDDHQVLSQFATACGTRRTTLELNKN